MNLGVTISLFTKLKNNNELYVYIKSFQFMLLLHFQKINKNILVCNATPRIQYSHVTENDSEVNSK